MAESKLTASIRRFMDELATDAAEERVVEYAVREVRNGRQLKKVLADPYVKNRLNEEKVNHVLENPEIASAIEQKIAESFQKRDFGFTD